MHTVRQAESQIGVRQVLAKGTRHPMKDDDAQIVKILVFLWMYFGLCWIVFKIGLDAGEGILR